MSELKLSGKTVKCPICEKNTALEEEFNKITSWLCVNCGYTSTTNFTENSDEFNSTPKAIMDLKKYDDDRKIYWIPTVINLPSKGLIFPEKHGRQIIWTYVPIIDIPESEQHNYPIAEQPGKYFTRRLEPSHSEKHTQFYDALISMGAIIELDELKENVKEK